MSQIRKGTISCTILKIFKKCTLVLIEFCTQNCLISITDCHYITNTRTQYLDKSNSNVLVEYLGQLLATIVSDLVSFFVFISWFSCIHYLHFSTLFQRFLKLLCWYSVAVHQKLLLIGNFKLCKLHLATRIQHFLSHFLKYQV